jgi:hypothetical protein
MKFMTTWAAQPGALDECVQRFLAGQAAPQEGVTLLGRWHNVDCSGGFSLYETDNPVQLYKGAVGWADLMDLTTVAVIEDAEAGPVLAARGKK